MKQLLQVDAAWWRFYERYGHSLRPVVVDTMIKIMACGLFIMGFATFRCTTPGCNHKKKICFGCKCRFCNTCGKKRTDQWLEYMKATLPDTTWQHITFTMPDTLWIFFEYNRQLQGKLSALAAGIMLKTSKKKGALPGIFTAIHTFVRDLKWNVHIHLAITLGGLTNDHTGWKTLYFVREQVMKQWRYEVIKLLRKEAKKGRLVIPPELTAQWQQQDQTLNDVLDNEYLKPYWHVWFADPTDNPAKTIEYLGRYISRPPIAMSRIKHYDGNDVVFEYLDHRDQKHKTLRCTIEDFIRRFIRHIPDKGFRMIRYYGFLAHRVRGKLLPTVYDLLDQPKKKALKIRYPELLKATYGIDPIKCILCGSQMVFCGITRGLSRAKLGQYHRELALRKKIEWQP